MSRRSPTAPGTSDKGRGLDRRWRRGLTVCPFTTDPTEAPLFRLAIEPDVVNGLAERSSLMVDKVTTVRRSKLGERVGRLSDDDMVRLGRAVLVFLGFAGA